MSDFINRLLGKSCSLKESILSHIQYLLNARKGSLLHLPDYGLSEYPIHQGFAEMQKKFVDDLKTVIERFEPRVSSLIIEGITNDTRNGVLQVSIQADLKVMEAINFQAQLLKNGEIRIMGDI